MRFTFQTLHDYWSAVVDHARVRHRPAYAEWLGAGALSDAAGLTQLADNPAALERLMRDLLHRSHVALPEVDYVSLHGTATLSNDRCEARAIRNVFGPTAPQLSCSSIKGAIGHLLGAAGSVEFATMLLAMRDGIIPPTINFEHSDETCAANLVTGHAQSKPVDVALKLSLGFGGHLVAGLVRRP